MSTCREIQKLLSGNRITLPKAFVKATNIKKGDPMILEWNMYPELCDGEMKVKVGSVEPKFRKPETVKKAVD